MFGAISSFILFFGCFGFILAAIFAVLAVLILVHEDKKGELKVYFVRRPVIRKYTTTSYTDEGDEFLLMYDKYNNKLSDMFSVKEYELAPTMELRQYP